MYCLEAFNAVCGGATEDKPKEQTHDDKTMVCAQSCLDCDFRAHSIGSEKETCTRDTHQEQTSHSPHKPRNHKPIFVV